MVKQLILHNNNANQAGFIAIGMQVPEFCKAINLVLLLF
jgi:hypothetical protein